MNIKYYTFITIKSSALISALRSFVAFLDSISYQKYQFVQTVYLFIPVLLHSWPLPALPIAVADSSPRLKPLTASHHVSEVMPGRTILWVPFYWRFDTRVPNHSDTALTSRMDVLQFT